MHPLLVNFSIFTWKSILESEEKAIKFLTEIGLIPSWSDKIKHVNCSNDMVSRACSSRKIGFQFVSKNYKKENNPFKTTLDAQENIFFKGTRISFHDILDIFCFILNLPIAFF